MSLHATGYERVRSVPQAVGLLAATPDAKVLAGGQSLFAAMRMRLIEPALLIDLQDVPDLQGVRLQDDGLWIGAMTPHAEVARHPMVNAHLPMLAGLAHGIADQQVRNCGTLGGSIANNDPAACYPAALLALAAQVHTDRRVLPASEFFTGMFSTALAPDELVTGVVFAKPLAARYMKFEQAASRFALVGIAVARHAEGVRVAVTGACDSVRRVPALEQALEQDFDAKALAHVDLAALPVASDLHAGADYRRHLVRVLCSRVVRQLAG